MNMSDAAPPVGPEPHLRDVRAFVAVAEHLHFTRAAQALFTSQPALSKQIRALERLLRVDLFVRDRRSVRLSTTGHALLPGARAVLTAWSAAQNDLAAAAAQDQTQLTVGITLGVERGLLPKIREQLTGLTPEGQLQLRRVSWSDPTNGLAPPSDLGVDAAFVWLPMANPERYEWLTVASEPRWLVMSARHRLAGRQQIVFADIADEPFVALPSDAGPARDFWLGADARNGQPAPVSGEAASSEELVEALTADSGVCLIAQGNLDAFRRNEIAAVPVTDLAPSQLVLAWQRGDDRPLLRFLIEATKRAVTTQLESPSSNQERHPPASPPRRTPRRP